MAFPLRALMGELSYRTVEIPVGRVASLRRAPAKAPPRVTPVVPAARGQPLVYWRPIAAAATFTLALVATVILTTRSSRAASEDALAALALAEPPASELASPSDLPPLEGGKDAGTGEAPPVAELPGPEPAPSVEPPPEIVPHGPAQNVADAGPKPMPPVRAPNLLLELHEQIREIVALPVPAACGGTHGTTVDFARSPVVAAKIAKREDKLLFLLHLSGNFEDDGFT